ncbi:MAG: adenosylcobinamide-GDP ribazoletransferase [Pseudomonadota bacterium]|nr:adenosylcobinamide-GDP ribazoletransferase [Pseudomonadota bacterium]
MTTIDNENENNIYLDWTDDLGITLRFLTRIPLPGRVNEGEEFLPLAPATRFFPVIGMITGATGGLVLMAGGWIGLPELAAALLALSAIAIVTGGLHEDGLADTADGMGGGSHRLARLAIMSDSHTGAFGVLALIFIIAAKSAGLAAIMEIDMSDAALTLFAASAASRGVLPVFMRYMPFAKEDGLAAAAGRPEYLQVAISCIITAAILLLSFGFWISLAALTALVIITGAIAWWVILKLGGQTGDVLGSIQQVSELVIILTVAAANT